MNRPDYAPEVMEDDVKPIAIYVLYLIALVTAVPFFVGVILAYLFKGSASGWARSHYDHQISLFWRFFIGNVILGVVFAIALPLSIVLIGIPIVVVVALAWVYLWLWMLFRCIKGIQDAREDQPWRGRWDWSI